ncbi:DUF5977 domain-containing protein [Rudanella lutea]|uniref:DUF5977 domain-containing protein n=1 Tax=Rudanella lutea TaxID=451374 RepID=UPI00035C8FEC|nr:hypothetical protein [Rudanella lutea]
MDALATLNYLSLRLTGNPMAYIIDAVPDSIGDRLQLVYCVGLNLPRSFGSGEYTELIKLPGREYPPRDEFGATVYPGASFDLALFLDDRLVHSPPVLGQVGFVTCSGQTTPFYVRQWVENGGALVAGTDKTLALEYALKGRLSVEQFAVWGDQFFTTYLAQSRQFLSWQPAEKWVDVAQPEWLYYLVNFTPKPTELRLRVEVVYSDGTSETLTLATTTGVTQYTVYSVAVGFAALGLASRETAEKWVHSYTVWIANEANARLSQARTYYVNRDYEANVLYLVYANSLGGFDTFRCTGQSSRQLTARGLTAQRALEPNYLPSTAELFSANRAADRSLTVATGLLDGDRLDAVSELVLAEEIYVVAKEGLVALLPVDTQLALQSDDEELAGRVLTYRYGKTEVGYSALPAPPVARARPTRWLPINTFCQVNENGVRTGYMGAASLELRYADDGSLVKPRKVKPNTPGTEGYTPPVLSAACAPTTTPYLNEFIEQLGTYLRSNCSPDQDARPATLTIAAGTYGAETVEQLQSRIDQALKEMDTQAYADLYGACLANPAGYTYSVPAGMFHYRGNLPTRLGIETSDFPWMGNAWTMQGRGAYCYATGTNDLDFPTAGFDASKWRLFTYGTAGRSARLRLYKNGTLYSDETFVFNSDGFGYHALFSGVSMASGDKLYVQLTDL